MVLMDNSDWDERIVKVLMDNRDRDELMVNGVDGQQ